MKIQVIVVIDDPSVDESVLENLKDLDNCDVYLEKVIKEDNPNVTYYTTSVQNDTISDDDLEVEGEDDEDDE